MLSEEIVRDETTVAEETTKEPKKRERRYSADEVQAMIDAAVAKAVAAQPMVVVQNAQEEMITLLYMGVCSEDCMVNLGEKIGEIRGRGGILEVPKKVFFANRTTPVLNRLKDRRLVVIDGLTDEERERYGLVYKEGEVLDQNVYYGLLGMNADQIVTIFRKACYRHKQLIASLFMEAYEAHDNRINQPLIERLNAVSKDADPNGMFTAIVKDMAKALADTNE